jgi:hypothetical protein
MHTTDVLFRVAILQSVSHTLDWAVPVGWFPWQSAIWIFLTRDVRRIPGEASYMIDLCVMQCGIFLLADDKENGTMAFVSIRRAGRRLLVREMTVRCYKLHMTRVDTVSQARRSGSATPVCIPLPMSGEVLHLVTSGDRFCPIDRGCVGTIKRWSQNRFVYLPWSALHAT